MKIIVAHPGKQHSFRLAAALQKTGDLYRYITTVYDARSSVLMKLVKRVIGKKDKVRADGRKWEGLPEDRVTCFCQLRGLLLLLILRLDKSRRIFDFCNRMVANAFGRKVARYAIRHQTDAVICYDSNAVACFKLLKQKAPQIVRIIDHAAANRYSLYRLYQEMDNKYGTLKDRHLFKEYLTDENKARYFKEEALLADYHIVASDFAAKTLTDLGIDGSHIFIVPYGVDCSMIPQKQEYPVLEKMKFLFVGEVSPQKGIDAYIAAAEKFNEKAEFHLVGGGIEKLSTKQQTAINSKMHYHGYLLQSDLFSLFKECDVFVFPSLGDGFGFVVIEAMAAGLPVICSENSVGGNAVTDGENGFLFPAGDVHALCEKIDDCISHPQNIQRMGECAHESAKDFTWENYEKKITEGLCEKIDLIRHERE